MRIDKLLLVNDEVVLKLSYNTCKHFMVKEKSCPKTRIARPVFQHL
ncbi:hypothetical protein LPICM17_130033 [Lactococcus piscium]|nr:hypothetical protein LP2241_20172 [Lactococcus piscium]SOB46969.1 hypothetical protein LPICM17_130033 [Lactococcus piscium]